VNKVTSGIVGCCWIECMYENKMESGGLEGREEVRGGFDGCGMGWYIHELTVFGVLSLFLLSSQIYSRTGEKPMYPIVHVPVF